MPEQIVLMRPHVTDAMRQGVQDVLHTRYIGQGPRVDQFERLFSQRIVAGRPSVAVGSCTDALHLAYLLAGIGPGDEVIAPLFTCTATNIPLLYCGAAIRFADVAPDSLNVDPLAVCAMVTEKTRAIVIVHYGGAMVDAKLIHEITGLPVIQDCAQALGAIDPGGNHLKLRTGFSCYSFQAVKHVTTGDGGMLVLPDQLTEKAKRMRWFGIDRAAKLTGTWANDISEIGFKYQMTDIGAAMGIAGLKSLDEQIGHRRLLAARYDSGLYNVPGIRMLDDDPNGAAWLCTVAVERRQDLRRKLAEHGIESDQTHYRNDRYSIFAQFRGEFPNMAAIEAKYLVLPMHMGMECGDVGRVCEVIRKGW